ncbi:short chain dehydrogenase/reductase family [Fusarium proliferatum]|nr:short chain dehydrogenase/reductase family [Fusarium proliferatum]
MASHLGIINLFSVQDTVAVITGGGSGLGATIAQALEANGARAVYVLGRREEKLRNIASSAVHGRIYPIVADVSSKDSLAAAVEQVHQREGHINVLIANSGMIGPNVAKLFSGGETPSLDKLREALWDVPMEDFTQTMNLNVTAAFYTVVAFLDLLAKGNASRDRTGLPSSQVIITTSISAFSRKPAAGFAYSASKAAATHLVKQLSTCFAPYKIRCNAIAPGFFPSEMTENMPWMKGSNPRLEGNLSNETCPLERSGTEEDIAVDSMAEMDLSLPDAFWNLAYASPDEKGANMMIWSLKDIATPAKENHHAPEFSQITIVRPVSEAANANEVVGATITATEEHGLPTEICTFLKLTKRDIRGHICIVLSELDQPVLVSLSSEELSLLQRLTQESADALWVTMGSLLASALKPEMSMFHGLARSLRAEVEGLPCMTVDFDVRQKLSPNRMVELITRVFDTPFLAERHSGLETRSTV